jgi:hypothetical protein
MAINIGKVTIGNLWKSGSDVFKVVISHLNRYPLMEVQDVYTLIYQGAMGAAYFAADADGFEERLLQEFAETASDKAMTLWETIRPDGELVRVHLGALKARGGTPQALSTLSLWTASIFEGDKEDLVDGWDTFQRLCADKRLSKYAEEEISAFTEWAEANDFPSTRHTQTFREAYNPHYRLIRREFLRLLLVPS